MKTGGSRPPNRIAPLLAAALLCCPIMLPAIEPNPTAAELQIGNQKLKPVAVVKGGQTTHLVGTDRFFIGGSAVQRAKPGSREPAWTARTDDSSELEWMAASTNKAYLLGYRTGAYGKIEYDSPARIRQLDLKTGKWLPNLPIPIPSDALEMKSVLDILADTENRVVILVSFIKRNSSYDGYEVAIFNERENQPLWTKEFKSAGERPYTGGYVWGVPAPAYARSTLRPLNWLGERLLVCPEAMQPLYCLNPDTGSELWHVERVWEFQRGFIGPSVWAHYISRLGIEDFHLRSTQTNLDQAKKDFDAQFSCALSGGPAVVPLHFERGEDTHSVFITTVKGPAKEWAGYLSDCVVYELGDDGKPISMGTLPQMAKGSQFCTHDGDVIWKCEHETFVCLSPVRSGPRMAMFGNADNDGLFNLAWSRRISYESPKAWLLTGKNGDPSTFGESWAYCVPGGGYILRKEDKQFHFPLAAINLSSGQDDPMVLNMPFDGNIILPDTNIGTESGENGLQFNTTINPIELALTYLEAHGNELDITIATESGKWTLSFDVGKTLAAAVNAPVARTNNAKALEPKHELRTQKDKDEALQQFARGTDTATVKALVKVGANPKYASDLGWTALMVAAAYGNAEMVDALIAAGADVNAADKNCGGQTVLIWASRSGKEPKQKVRSLLKAGANLNAATTNGWNALMAAANWGDLAMVEYLLDAGMNVSSRDHDGDTVLIAAASGEAKPNVLSTLIKAGADVNATNNDGVTALMRTARDTDTAEAVKVLLQAGADPNLKDKKGDTALAIATEELAKAGQVPDDVVKILKSVTKLDASNKTNR